jgi:CubicO group peptidase (beta-lactamase class C family)
VPAAPDTTLADADATAAAIAAALPEAAPASILEVLEDGGAMDVESPVATAGEVPPGPASRAIGYLEDALAALVEERGGGIVAGVLLADGTRKTIIAGTSGTDRPLDAASVFELGSITKLYTATLLADMSVRGEVSVDTPVARYLPGWVRLPGSGDREITLGDLATHRSGLQSNPTVIRSPDPDRPLAEFTDVAQLYRMVSGYRLPRVVGVEVHHSNAGFGLLGAALGRRAGMPYDSLLRQPVLEPLGLHQTATVRGSNDDRAVVAGHDEDGAEVPPFATPAFPGSGDLRASLDDVLGFAAANVAPTGELAEALAFAQGVQDGRNGMGWLVEQAEGRTMLLESGSTPGFSSAIVLDRTWGLAVVVLANTAGVDVLDMGLHALAPNSDALQRAPEEPSPAAVPADVLRPFMGTYALPDADVVLAVTDGGDGLVARVDGGDPIPLVPTGDGLVVADGDSTITFEGDDNRRITGLVLHQLGEDIPGRRVAGP